MGNLLYSRFTQLIRLSLKAKQEEEKARLILAAFVGWQMGAAGDKTLGDYLAHLGLADKPTPKAPVDDTAMLKRMGIKKVEG